MNVKPVFIAKVILWASLCSVISISFASKDVELDDQGIFGPGDRKHGYESEDYVTNSLSLQSRQGKEANLIEFIKNPPLGLPALELPKDNPITEEKLI